MDDFLNSPIPETIRELVVRVLRDIPTDSVLSGIYAITNEVTQQLYVGSSKNIRTRLTTHIKMLHAKKHHSYKLQRSFNTHGLASFSFKILELVDDSTQLFTREQHYMDLHSKKRNKLLNVSKTADPSHYVKKKRKTRKPRKTTKKAGKRYGKTKSTH